MKLILLPGMDGTGELFESLVDDFAYDWQIIPLPVDGGQTYAELAARIVGQLPNEDYVILAESFSGGLLPYLIRDAKRKPAGAILVTCFLHIPRPILIPIFSFLPLKQLIKIPGIKILVKFFCMKGASSAQFNSLWKIIKTLHWPTIKRRLKTISKMDCPAESTEIPVLYIMAADDKLVPRYISNRMVNNFRNIKITTIQGPHFLLQTKTAEASAVVMDFLNDLAD